MVGTEEVMGAARWCLLALAVVVGVLVAGSFVLGATCGR